MGSAAAFDEKVKRLVRASEQKLHFSLTAATPGTPVMRKPGPYETRARELALAASVDPDSRIERPGAARITLPISRFLRPSLQRRSGASGAKRETSDCFSTASTCRHSRSEPRPSGESSCLVHCLVHHTVAFASLTCARRW